MKLETGTLIKQARRRARLTQQQVAEVCGVDRAAVSQWESGKTKPRYEQLQKFSQLVNEPMSYFLDTSATPPTITPDEAVVLAKYRTISAKERVLFTALLDLMSPN